MRATLSLVAFLIIAMPVLGTPRKGDPQLESRAREYFASLVASDFARLWDMTSPSVRGEMDDDRDAFVERMSQMAPYDMKFVLLACCSYEPRGWVYLEIHIRQTKSDVWDVRNYEALWVRTGDEWYLDSLGETQYLESQLKSCDRVPSSPN